MREKIALILLVVYTICEVIAYLPQMIKLIKTRSADDLSITSWLIWVISGVCYLAYVLLSSPEIGVIYIASMNLVFMMTVYVLTVYYQRKSKKSQKYTRKIKIKRRK